MLEKETKEKNMNRYNNYQEINTLDLLLQEIEKAISAKSYLSALYMSLSIPDMLGKVSDPKYQGNKYIKWFDENVQNISFEYLCSKSEFDSLNMSGEICYRLRCKLYHEGINDIRDRTMVDEFVLSLTDDDYVRGNYAGTEYDFNKIDPETKEIPSVNYLYISCKGLCKEIVLAAKEFYKKNPNLNYPKLKINHDGGKFSNVWHIK